MKGPEDCRSPAGYAIGVLGLPACLLACRLQAYNIVILNLFVIWVLLFEI